nr:vegetative cell wall protein gp1-like [Aegilops tauschii subsp. strangulata]
MASRVSLSGSLSSESDSSLPSLPPPPAPAPRRPVLKSIIVPQVLGTAFDPLVQGGRAGPSHAAVPLPLPDGGWRTKAGRRPRATRAPAPHERKRHISADCTNLLFCVWCHGVGHISRGCTRPHIPSLVEQPSRPPPALWCRMAVDRTSPSPPSPPRCSLSPPLPPPPPGPPPPGAVRLRSDVVRVSPVPRPSSVCALPQLRLPSVGDAAGPEFLAPFGMAEAGLSRQDLAREDMVEDCFLEAAEDT